jgi:hypothetical protein
MFLIRKTKSVSIASRTIGVGDSKSYVCWQRDECQSVTRTSAGEHLLAITEKMDKKKLDGNKLVHSAPNLISTDDRVATE